MEFILKFKYKKVSGYWCTTIRADTVDEAIKEAEYFILKDKRIEKASLSEIVYRHKKIKEWNIVED